jgi:hypothetical protein
MQKAFASPYKKGCTKVITNYNRLPSFNIICSFSFTHTYFAKLGYSTLILTVDLKSRYITLI